MKQSKFIIPLALIATLGLTACDTAPSDPVEAAQAAVANGAPRIALEHVSEALKTDPDNVELRLLAGDLSIALGNPDRAVTEFEHVAKRADASSLAKAKLAEAYLLGNYMRAAKEAVETLSFDVPLAYTAAVGIDMAEGDLASAYARLDEGLEKFPGDPRLVTIDAERLFIFAQPTAAKKRLAPVLALPETVVQAHVLAGQMALGDRETQKARGHFEKVLKAHPEHQTAMLAMAAIARDSGNDAEAVEWLTKSGANGYTHPIGMLFLAQIAFDAGDIDQAYELNEQIPPVFSNEPQFARLRGFIDSARGQHGAVILALMDYVKEHPNDIAAARVLAQSYAAEGEPDNAWSAIAPAVSNPQTDTGTLQFALELSQQTGKGDAGAIRSALERKRVAPDLAGPMREAVEAIRASDWAKADSIYTPLIAGGGKDNAVLLNNAAAVKTKLGKYDKAVELARRADSLVPNSPIILDTLGWALWKQGKNKVEAQRLLTRALEGAPENREIAQHWAAAHEGA